MISREILKPVVLSVAALSVAACQSGGTITTRSTPNGQAMILSADNRAVFFAEASSSNSSAAGDQLRCAEPQPDVARAIAQEFASALKATIPILGSPSPVSASIAGASREAIAELGRRTPTVQLMRDTLYRACEAVMNGVLLPNDPIIDAVILQLDNVMLGLHAVDGLTGLGNVGKATISATASAPAKGSTTADGTSAESGQQSLTAEVKGGGVGLDEKSAAAIAQAVVQVVDRALGQEDPQALARLKQLRGQ